jgi:hypothetical protein
MVVASAKSLLKTYYKNSDLWKVLGANGHSITFARQEATRVSKISLQHDASIYPTPVQPAPASVLAPAGCSPSQAATAGGKAEQTEEPAQPPPLPAAGHAAKGALAQKQRLIGVHSLG